MNKQLLYNIVENCKMKKNIIAIIQARIDSTRLPGKIFKTIIDKTMLEHIINRVKSVPSISMIVVATTLNQDDNIVEDFCKAKGIECFRGSEDNVLERFYTCASTFQADGIVRVTADDPLKDPQVIAKAIDLFLKGGYDYVSNTVEPTYPEGIDIEVFSFAALEKAYREAKLPSEKQHVTPYIYKNPDKFHFYNFKNGVDLSSLRWTVDSPDDYVFMQEVYRELYRKPNEIFLMDEVCALLERKPHLKEINGEHVRNEGYIASLKEEEQDSCQ